MNKLTHVNIKGDIKMVNVSGKESTDRECSAYGEVYLSKDAFRQIIDNKLKKGDVFTTAKVAGIQGAKKTWELIPLCHNIPINTIDVKIEPDFKSNSLKITSYAQTDSNTGIEMEAITAVAVTAITIYDMCKSVDKDIIISNIQLIRKKGGKSGSINRKIVRK